MTLIDELRRANPNEKKLNKNESIQQTIEEAYSFQMHLVEEESQNGNPLIGYKISLTSQETQKLFGAREPLYGALTKDSLVSGGLPLDELSEPLIEVELMFIVDQDIKVEDDEITILNKTRVAPGIEIPDSRFEDWFPNLTLHQIICDRAVAGKVVVGEPVSGLTINSLKSIKADVRLNHETIATGYSSEVLGNPVNAVKWLCQELSKTEQCIQKGMIISSGTFIMPKRLERGSYQVNFVGLGEIQFEVY
ncbi:2-keto-4-pentenoate hydratase [Alkalibacillus filiformis]|uniref:2-keto-4-pentenoate hydratase n=1 Tax=Alkalibacillus filiformis TaxID=200990 RepID=A0ABU0DSF1_9BACI|nr:hypothetical protein [Alkalibacillus filiformis]MDQ0351377.1 2-keto-4-pentenoate hydratase [Alkalibacillus filiformis]